MRSMHVKCKRSVLMFSLGVISKDVTSLGTRITSLLMHLLGMFDIIVQLQAAIGSAPIVWSLKSMFAPASTRFFLTDEVRFWRRPHIWGFGWSCTGNILDIKWFGLLRSDRNELCIWRRGVGRHHRGKGSELPRGWAREHFKSCNQLTSKDGNQFVRAKERKQNGSFRQRTTESFMLHFIFYRRGDSTLNPLFSLHQEEPFSLLLSSIGRRSELL